MPEVLVVTVKKHPELSALFINTKLIYVGTLESPARALAGELADALNWNTRSGSFRSVNLPYKEGLKFGPEHYVTAKRYLEYRDRSAAYKAGRDYDQPVVLFNFSNDDDMVPAPSVALSAPLPRIATNRVFRYR